MVAVRKSNRRKNKARKRLQFSALTVFTMLLLFVSFMKQIQKSNLQNVFISNRGGIVSNSGALRNFLSSLFSSTSKKEQRYDILLQNYNPSFTNPGWSCSNNNPNYEIGSPKYKLIFIHVFKTAGSSLRTFFRNYAAKCQKGVATIITCSDVTSESIYSSDPQKIWDPSCTSKEVTTRKKGTKRFKSERMTREILEKHVDVAIGHFPYGMHKKWRSTTSNTNTTTDLTATITADDNTQLIVPQYITFVRAPDTKFVSALVYTNKHLKWNTDQAVQAAKTEIRHLYQNNKYYNYYKNYLLFPEQKDFDNPNISEQEWVYKILMNLVDTHTMIGVVERMDDSLSLLQSIIDVDESLTKELNELVSKHKNKSKLSTSEIVRFLKEDKEIWEMMTEVLKYEFELYNFAVRVHELQVEALKENHGRRYSLTGS